MAEDNVVVKPVTIPNSFDPSEDTESSPATSGEEDNNLEETKETKTAKEKPVDETEREETGNTEQKRERKPRMEKPGVSSLSIEDYRSLYFHHLGKKSIQNLQVRTQGSRQDCTK